jgi:LAO/AO transport system kinase
VLNLVENRRKRDEVAALLSAVAPAALGGEARAHIVGVTGPPGAGKSTLVDQLASAYRKGGRTVGIVAVDPSSPFTGGAILGDRVRMSTRQTDPDVFIRSMATRGHLGGLARASADAVRFLDAAGKDVVLVETVGVGQAEVDVVRLADTVLVLTVPGLGDDIQAAKAGLMEIGDVFVVNKADREGADRAAAELQSWLEQGEAKDGWAPPVLRTASTTGAGVPELLAVVDAHREHLQKAGLLDRKREQQAEHEVLDILRERVTRWALDDTRKRGFQERVHAVAKRHIDPYTAADLVLPEERLEDG